MDILVFVNQPFHNDPRVHRTVQYLGQHGYKITVASGTLERPLPSDKNLKWGRVYYLRTFKAGQISWLRSLVRFVAGPTQKEKAIANKAYPKKWHNQEGTQKDKSRMTLYSQKLKQSSNNKSSNLSFKQILNSMVFLGQLLNFLQLNLRLIIRFYRLPVKLYYPNDIDVAVAAAVLAWLHKKPLLYETHEFHTDQTTAHPAWYQRVLLFIEGWIAKQAANVIVVGEDIAQLIHKQYHLNKQPGVIKNCPPYQQITRSMKLTPLYKLLYHGVYQPKRGLEYLILAMHQIDKAHLYLRGFGYWEKTLHDLVVEEKLENKVTFLPAVPMQELVEEAIPFDVGVGAFQDVSLSSRYCLPNKVFEYMMAGLALAVSDFPELRRVVNVYNVGVTFDPADPADIARQINHLLADPENLYLMQIRALAAAKETFNFEQEGLKLKKIIEDVIGSPESEALSIQTQGNHFK